MTPPLEVLLVEDNPGDVLLTREAFQGVNRPIHLNVARDGVEALEWLRREAKPALILLDFNLPRMSGREVLSELKTSRDLRTIPVVVLTTSRAESDVSDAYELGTNGFVTKPMDLGELFRVIQSIGDFWLGAAALPADSQARYLTR